jgi:formate-dependent nitrite reductase membrane component NrfD
MHERTRGLPVVACLFMARLGADALIALRIDHQKAFYSDRAVAILIPVSVLIGGLMLGYVVLIAGQITYPIGL